MAVGLVVLVVVLFLVVLFLISAIKVAREYERGIVFRLGRLFPEPKGPGLFLLIPVVDRMVKVDLRTITLNIPPQEVITKDNVPVRVNAVTYFRIVAPKEAIVQVENFMVATSQKAQTTLRSVLGQHVLDELLSEREKINAILQEIIDEATGPWGIKVSAVEVKDVEIPAGMQRAMARQAEAERERRAKVINAEGEFQASERLKDAALVIEEHPIALQLRYLQTLLEIGGSSGTSTIIFPAPIDLIRPFLVHALAVDQDRAHAERDRALDVVRDRVADHHRVAGLDSEQLEDGAEDRRVWLGAAVVEGADPGVDVEPVVARELPHVAGRVRDEPDAEAGGAERRERGRHIVVQLEVLVLLPAARDLHGAVIGRVGVAAHAADDALGEAEPDLVVVLELGMAAELDESRVAGGLVASGLEGEPMALAGADVPLRPELRSRPRQREVDVEEDRPEH